MYQSTKLFGHDLGLSACFRQHRATHSHCSQLHGYALSFKFVFEAETLDDCNWVQDFGGLKELKLALMRRFDHKLLVAEDDPMFGVLCALSGKVADVLVVPSVGCEAFAKQAYIMAADLLSYQNRVRVVSCECAEHGANSAIFKI